MLHPILGALYGKGANPGSLAALGPHKVQNAPFKLSETPASNYLSSPLIGQHTREIVEGLLGYSHEELRAGFADGTFWPTKRARFPYMEEMLQ